MAAPQLVEGGDNPVASPKRAAILEGAIAEFLALGFDGASMDRIATRAGVSKQTIYTHFSSKDGLVEAINREALPRPDASADICYNSETPLDTQLMTIAAAILQVLTSDKFVALTRIAVAREVADPQAAGPMVSAGRERFTASTIQWVEAAVQDGRLDVDDPWLAVSQFLGSLQSAAFWPLVLGGRRLAQEKQERLVRSSVAMFLNYYAKQ